jgi:hypothetical protein
MQSTVIHLIPFGRETWCLILRTEHVAKIGKWRSEHKILVARRNGIGYWRGLSMGRSIILKCVMLKVMNFVSIRIDSMVGFCEFHRRSLFCDQNFLKKEPVLSYYMLVVYLVN